MQNLYVGEELLTGNVQHSGFFCKWKPSNLKILRNNVLLANRHFNLQHHAAVLHLNKTLVLQSSEDYFFI